MGQPTPPPAPNAADFLEIVTPPLPPARTARLYFDTTSGELAAIDSDGNSVIGGGASYVNAEVPTGATPGTAFTLAHTPKLLVLVLNGLVQAPGGVDFTLAGAAITMVNAVQSTDSFFAWYIW